MSDPTTPGPTSPEQVGEHLHTIAKLLRQTPHLGPQAQQLLAELVDELSRALESGPVPAAELTRIADHVAQLVQATHGGEDAGPIGKIRQRLEAAVTAVEVRAPMVAGVTRRLIEALSELGI
jgi:hypothetical protein